MECFYINLNSEHTRRAHLEQNFLENKRGEWSLTRFPAIDTSYIDANEVFGTLGSSEKACFLSHKHLIGSNLNNKKTYFYIGG